MSSLLSTFSCCWFWLLVGLLVGWLLNRCLCKCCCKTDQSSLNITTSTAEAPASKLVTTPTPDAKSEQVATIKSVTIDLASAKAAGFAIKSANDLTAIEGIGPKISELFKDNGIKTFADLAKLTAPQMRTILDKGGSRFRIANPETWAEQAMLASNNKWTDLKKLQSELSGGVKK